MSTISHFSADWGTEDIRDDRRGQKTGHSGNSSAAEEGAQMIKYVFRMPIFPMIIEIDGQVIAARSRQGLEKKLSGMTLTPGRTYEGVDSTGEVWFLYADSMMLSPLTLRKRATKLQLIRLVNS